MELQSPSLLATFAHLSDKLSILFLQNKSDFRVNEKFKFEKNDIIYEYTYCRIFTNVSNYFLINLDYKFYSCTA